jgi:hypothetical protein
MIKISILLQDKKLMKTLASGKVMPAKAADCGFDGFSEQAPPFANKKTQFCVRLRIRPSKTIPVWARFDTAPAGPNPPVSKSFLLLFFKKEALASLSLEPVH